MSDLLTANAGAAAAMSRALFSDHYGSKSALGYLERRGFSHDEIRKYGIGYASPPVRSDNPDAAPILRHFLSRIVWPIRNAQGQIVGFGGRAMDDNPAKYKNSAESEVYHKGENLYGIDLAIRDIAATNRAVIVEGYMDVCAAHRAGITTAVGICGTAMSWEQGILLLTACSDVVLSLDGDEAGRRATERIGTMLYTMGFNVFVAELPDGADPDSMIASNPESYCGTVRSATRFIEWMGVRGRRKEAAQAIRSRDRLVASLATPLS